MLAKTRTNSTENINVRYACAQTPGTQKVVLCPNHDIPDSGRILPRHNPLQAYPHVAMCVNDGKSASGVLALRKLRKAAQSDIYHCEPISCEYKLHVESPHAECYATLTSCSRTRRPKCIGCGNLCIFRNQESPVTPSPEQRE
jgi:hypothetical protein